MKIRELGKSGSVGGRALLLTLAIGAMMHSGPARSYVLPTVEVPGASLVAQILNQANTALQKVQDAQEYAQTLERWKRTLQQYQQALVRVQAIVNSFGLPSSPTMTPVAEDYMVSESCGGDFDFSLSSLLSTFVLDLDGDIKSQQKKVCASIQMMRNRKYNDSVKFITDTLPQMKVSLDRILNVRTGQDGNDQGQVQGADSESLRLANDLAVQAQAWEARMQSYDAYIGSLTQIQNVLAQKALKGKNSLASNLVKTAALKAALSID